MKPAVISCAVLGMLLLGCQSGPKFQGWDTDRLYAHAQERYAAEDWNEAIEALTRALAVGRAFAQAPEARLLLAQSHFGKGEFLTASSEFVRFLERFPGHGDAPIAALGICQSYAAASPIPERDQTYTQQALTSCRNVESDYAGTPSAVSAGEVADRMRDKLAHKDYEAGEWYFRRKLFDSAIIYFEEVVTRYPRATAAPMAMLRLYQANSEIGYDDIAGEWRDRLVQEHPESEAARLASANVNGANGG